MSCRVRRQEIVPFAFAVLLTVAAGLSLAEEHAWAPAAAPGRPLTPSASADRRSPPEEGAYAGEKGRAGSDSHRQAGSRAGVGSRALTGHEAHDPAVPAINKRP